MYLSKLEIIGFKSFAQKVNMAFDSGISAIVGPNGCGKTNIVDAIRWVLGEQRYSALRSDKMEDVIFNGTKQRKPLGMAEVSLIIENTRGILPSEYTQVTIGRRVYRSGESEYLLNKVPCRLKDILDLFMDTGMGPDAYSVIELKMVETILSDKTDERRRLFEEAAGVTKYKHRRKAAYRKLESVQTDLVRVNDIVLEVHKAVNSLERQAKKAEQYNDVKNRLRSLEVDLMEREFAQLHLRMKPLEERLASLNVDKDRIDVDLTKEETHLDELRSLMADVERRLAETQRDASIQLEKINRVEQQNLIAAERIKALRDNVMRYETEKVELNTEMHQLEAAQADLLKRIGELEAEEGRTASELQRHQAELHEFEGRLDAKKTELQSMNDRTIQLVHEIAEKQTERDRNRGLIDNLHGRVTHAAEENVAYEQEIIRIGEQIAQLSAEDKQLRRAFTEAEVRYYDAETRKKEIQEKLDLLKRNELEKRSEIERKHATVDFLKGLIESREGLSESVRFLSSTNRWTPRNRLTVADAVHADERYRAAIESALGDLASLMVVESVNEAEEAISLLKDVQKGKATFVCLNRLPRVGSRWTLPNARGVCGWAVDLARYDDLYAQLFRFLLDGVLVVETREVAQRIIRRLPGVRCVTLEGEIATGVGITKGGSKRHDEGGTIGKQRQIEDSQRQIAQLTDQLAGLASKKEELERTHDSIQLRTFSDAVKAVEKEMHAVEMRIAQLEFEKKRAGDIIAKNKEEIEALSIDAASLQNVVTVSEPELGKVRGEKAEVERGVGALQSELDTLEREWNERAKAVNDLSIKIVTVKGDLQNAHNELKRAQETFTDIVATLEKRDADIKDAQTEIGSADSMVEENAGALEVLRRQLEVIEQRKTTVEEESTKARNEIHRIELRIKDERRLHDDSLKSVHDLELRIADLKAKAEHIKARALEEFEMRIELKAYPDDEFVDFAAHREEIQTLRDKVKSLGNINFAAYEEYTTEKGRYEFLSAQR
ncbi:MAG: chromosome segregation protein SMC, partial [Ignavibacteriae bacterium]|nr:chromosome segregation protein SMC [Ignavibacteriota bacterium]